MFDTLICEYPLPDGKKFDSFQTKSLECMMYDYRITTEGELHERAWDLETQLPWKRVILSGSINFYTSDKSGWCEYVATFNEGKLTAIARASRLQIHPERQEILQAISELKEKHGQEKDK